MGNALIQDSATGQMMELREGFVPVGMKEHGGILYIVSADKEGNGEIGTIPSPIITWDYADATGAINDYLIADGKDIYNICQVSTKLHPGEQYALILHLDSGIWDNERKYFTCPNLGYYDPIKTLNNNKTFWENDYSPIISTINQKGYYTLNLYACNDYNNYLIDDITSQQYYRQDQDNIQNSNFWFIPSQSLLNSEEKLIPLNQKYMSIDNCFKKFPGTVPAGRLAVKASLENIGRFELVKRAGSLINPSLGESYLPYTMTIKEGDTEMYYTYFSSFRYKSDSSVRVNKLEVKIIKKADQGEEIPIYRHIAGGHQSINKGILNYASNREIDLANKKEKYELADNLIDYNLDPSGDFYTFKYDNWYYLQRKVYGEEAENNGFKSFDASKISSDRHGLFYIKSSEYNVWYIMQVKYYDQCDRLLGTYEVEFNPFYNDYIGDGSDEIEVEEKRKQDNFKKVEKTDEFKNQDLTTFNFEYYDNLQDIKDNYMEFKRVADYATFNLKPAQPLSPQANQSSYNYLYPTLPKYTEEYLLTNCNIKRMKLPFALYAAEETYKNTKGEYYPAPSTLTMSLSINEEDVNYMVYNRNVLVALKRHSSSSNTRCTDPNADKSPNVFTISYYNNNTSRDILGGYLQYTSNDEVLWLMAPKCMKKFSNTLFGKLKTESTDSAWKCHLGSQFEPNQYSLNFKSDGQVKFIFNSSTYKIIPQVNHYYKYTDKDTAEIIKIPGNLKETSIYKTTLWLDENNKPYNFVNIEEVLDDNNVEVGIQKSSDLREKETCPNHSINLDVWADSKLSAAVVSPTNIKTYDVVSFQSLNPGTYVINFYGYDVAYNVNRAMAIRLQLGDITMDLISGQPVVIKLDHQVSKANIKFVIIPNSPNSTIKQCHAFTDFGIYQTNNVDEMPANQVCLVSAYKDKVIMPLAETFVESNIVCGDTTFNYEYSPKYAYETNVDMDGKICQYTVKKGVYETYENVASLIKDDKHTSHLDKNNPPIIRFTNE